MISKLRDQFIQRLILMTVFAVAMAYIEAAIVVYLRELYYPEGFAFPLKLLPTSMLMVELGRELATLVMLASVALVVAKKRWVRFGWFIFLFGVWDIWYYIWLKLTIGWPSSLFEWDILFLIPVPWTGPVVAPVIIALSMAVIGVLLVRKADRQGSYHPGKAAWILALTGSALILYTFMSDSAAVLNQEHPEPYSYWLWALGVASYWAAFFVSNRKVS
jgi:hypothetical protein